MAKKVVIVVVIAAVVVVAVATGSASVTIDDGSMLDMGSAPDPADAPAYPDRLYGGIDTSNASPLKGDPSAPVTIVEFGDYQCHFCELWHRQTLPLVTDDYIESGHAKLVFVDFAFLGKDSPKAAQASYCADDQGMYWEYHDKLYESQQSRIDGGWASSGNLHAFATELGLDMDEFGECMSSGKHAERVSFNTDVGSVNGVEATPTFFILGSDGDLIMISGAQPYGSFVRAINSVG